MPMHPDANEPRTTFFDRLAVGLLAAVAAFVTGLIIYGFALAIALRLHTAMPPFIAVWWFTAGMAVFGFLLKDTWLATIFGRLWQMLYTAIRTIGGG